ncbi:MAG: hypothetical protein JRI72_00115 [Deltaproteobacteria bacterium]|nr:hypothetical protein [Deltaproteobacteria bacterium]
MLSNIDLQLFGEVENEEVNENTDANKAAENTEVTEANKDSKEVNESKVSDAEVDKDKYIPKEVALKWKRNSRELQRELRRLKESEFERENKSRLEKIRSRAKERGLDDDVAEIFGEIAGELISLIPKQDAEETEILEDFNDFLEEYPEAKSYKKEIIEKVKLYRKADPDFTIEDAYRLMSPSKSTREMQLEAEQRAAIARRSGDKEPTPSVSSQSGSKYPLTDDEKRIVKLLQQAHPEKGWTNKKYYETVVKPKRDIETKIR